MSKKTTVTPNPAPTPLRLPHAAVRFSVRSILLALELSYKEHFYSSLDEMLVQLGLGLPPAFNLQESILVKLRVNCLAQRTQHSYPTMILSEVGPFHQESSPVTIWSPCLP